MGMQRFELVDGASSKFWEVEVVGNDLTVRFGRIGTAGQSKTRPFGDAVSALKERDKLIREKTRKGYLQLDGVQGATAEMTKPSPRVEIGVQSAAPAAATDPVAGSAESGDAAPIAWPTGGFQMKPAWRQAMPPIRGINAPPLTPAQVLLPELFAVSDSQGWGANLLAKLARGKGRAWTYWTVEEARERVTPDALANPDPEFWLELLTQARCGRKDHALPAAVRACADLHGLSFALEAVFGAREFLSPESNSQYTSTEPYFTHLRQAIACAGEADYLAVLQTAERLRVQNPRRELACAHLFPHLSQWTVECLDKGVDEPGRHLLHCAMPCEHFVRYLKAKWVWTVDPDLRAALVLQLCLHGDSAVDALMPILSRHEALDILAGVRVPRLVNLLVERMERKEVRDTLDDLAKPYPAAVLKTAIERLATCTDRAVEGWTLRLAIREADALRRALAAVDEKPRSRFLAALAVLQPEEAPLSSLPPLLREPPWLGRERPPELPTFETPVLATVPAFDWDAALLKQARAHKVSAFWNRKSFPGDFGITPDGVQRLQKGELLQPGDTPAELRPFVVVEMVLLAPEAVRLALWNSYPAERFGAWSSNLVPICAILDRYGFAAVPGLLGYFRAFPDKAAPLAEMVDSPLLVHHALHMMRNSKKHREIARRWVRKYPRTVLFKALPEAFGPEQTTRRDNARHALRWLADQGFAEIVREVAETYGPPMPAALDSLLRIDPLFVLPGVMPGLPAFFVAASCRRPESRAGGGLPLAAVEHIATMLAISKVDAPYPGLAIIKEYCTEESLGRFVWDLFEAWLSVGAPSKEAWAFHALGLLGDDRTARRLVPLIRVWPDQSVPARALAGLEILAAIGSDVALMYLNGLAARGKHKRIQKRAAELIDAVAEARGLSADELADRLVPDLGLDQAGAAELDFGPRKFQLRFDETLDPYLRDADGLRLKTLPRQVKTDDAALAGAAIERFKQLRKDARALASLQVARLERAMVNRRRWPATDFRSLFIEHPLMRHLATRVLWGVFEGDRLARGFRVAEDWSFADADDAGFDLAAEASVGIPHILEMPPEVQAAFGRIYTDYELAQPFRQLWRETYALTDEEMRGSRITRFKDKVVFVGSILGLNHRGWERGEVVDGTMFMSYSRWVDDEMHVDVELDPGSPIGDTSSEPRQRMPAVVFCRRDLSGNDVPVPFADLDPIIASEVLRDLDLLAPARE